jgi:hypothetical protein
MEFEDRHEIPIVTMRSIRIFFVNLILLDVYSFGVVVWEIFEFGKYPWAAMSNVEASANVLKGYHLDKPEKCPDAVYQIMLSCWNFDPQKRPNFIQIYHDISRLILKYPNVILLSQVFACLLS